MLYIISTPIGNIDDITLRALNVLEEIDILLCEDTRVTSGLLQKVGIKNIPELVSFYDEIEEQKIPRVIEWLKKGLKVGLVTDAGTPVVSDPGYKLIKKCQEIGVEYTALPGPCAAVNALVLSGLPTGRFNFLGFLPKKTGERKRILESYKNIDGSKIIYESPFRLCSLIADIKEIYGEATQIRICREMTKKFEEIKSESTGKEKGELVVVFN